MTPAEWREFQREFQRIKRGAQYGVTPKELAWLIRVIEKLEKMAPIVADISYALVEKAQEGDAGGRQRRPPTAEVLRKTRPKSKRRKRVS